MIRCLIVDDERFARELIEDNIRLIPFLDLVASCKNTDEAMKVMATEQIDLVFLDIQMPGLSGIQWLGAGLINSPMVIMITAYENYALEGFNLNVLDYVVKPVAFDRFLKAANKAMELYMLKNKQAPALPAEPNTLFVNSDYSLVRINMDHITHIEGLKDYIKIFQLNTERPIIPRLTLHYMEAKLPATSFLRVHRSYIVALDKIISIKRNRLYLPDADIPFTDNYRPQLMEYIGQHS
ncbi:two component transcriptional regulator, LytTR family [Pedobacter westerhofensis]|uniref:Two component transcriptional regulator, LytTR family n=1 Tax=Pedobacter westerhofensis TaxID=425512 RepID=A0A521CZ33_9SPHI|nr:response regulator transcription factor [Pedobacter westerhofensis]SMO64709.1 two component transcriptional regulator, LytTR family [Pedobacter westerhofensis]